MKSTTMRRSNGNDGRSTVIAAERERERIAKLRAPVMLTSKARERELARLLRGSASTSTEAQVARVLRALRTGPLTAMEARDHLDIQHAPARIAQLRRAGHSILGAWVKQESPLGYLHRTMCYMLAHDAGGAT